MNLIKDNKEIEQQKEEIKKENINKEEDYSFIINILRNNIGNLIDDFTKTNMGQPITKYNAGMFSIWCIEAFKKTKEDIVNHLNNINKK